MSGGTKYDAGKLPLELLPVDALEAVALVMDLGAKKYSPRNWEEGFVWSRLYGALLRHLFAFWRGADRDHETGQPHLAHAACCVLFLLSHQLRNLGADDRPILTTKEKP